MRAEPQQDCVDLALKAHRSHLCKPQHIGSNESTAARRPAQVRIAAIASLCAACLIAGFLGARYWSHHQSIAVEPPATSQQSSLPLDQTLDLTNYGTYRGAEDQPPRPPVNLPATLLHVNLILPRFSEAGPYTIMVVSDREGNGRVAYATGNAVVVGNQTKLIVTLDLRRVRPGNYVLLTELNGQNDWYSYPLKIQ